MHLTWVWKVLLQVAFERKMVRVFNDKIWAYVDTRSSTDSIFHRNGRTVKKNPGILSQIEKEVEGRDDNFIDHVVRLEDAVAH